MEFFYCCAVVTSIVTWIWRRI